MIFPIPVPPLHLSKQSKVLRAEIVGGRSTIFISSKYSIKLQRNSSKNSNICNYFSSTANKHQGINLQYTSNKEFIKSIKNTSNITSSKEEQVKRALLSQRVIDGTLLLVRSFSWSCDWEDYVAMMYCWI